MVILPKLLSGTEKADFYLENYLGNSVSEVRGTGPSGIFHVRGLVTNLDKLTQSKW